MRRKLKFIFCFGNSYSSTTFSVSLAIKCCIFPRLTMDVSFQPVFYQHRFFPSGFLRKHALTVILFCRCSYVTRSSAESNLQISPYHHRHNDNVCTLVHFQVSKREYEDCNIYNSPPAIMIVNCSQPKSPKVFTLLFDPFSSIPNVPEYMIGGTYYYISKF